MVEIKTTPWEHQRECALESRKKVNFAKFMEMGTGKTLTEIIELASIYNDSKKILRTLVICPVVVVPNWGNELRTHTNLPTHRIQLLEGSQKKRVASLKQAFESLGTSHIVVSNYESLLMKELFALYQLWAPEILVFDESHKLKTHNTRRTKAAIVLADAAHRTHLLSGTPVLNSPMDLYSQYRVMDGGKSFGKNFYSFRMTYFYDKNSGMPSQKHFPNWILKPNSVEQINRVVNETSYRKTKAECLQLPPLVKRSEYVELSPTQKTLYNEMKRDFITYIGGKACVANIALTKGLRLMQILSGFIKTHDGEEQELKATPRIKALTELLEQLTPKHKVIVWAVFKHNFKQIKQVCEKLGVEYAEVHGGVSGKARQENIDRFTDDDRCRVFIGHPGAGGIGINLTVSSYSIYFSRGFSLEHDLQSEARNHRGGSERHNKITRIDLVCKDTLDEVVLRLLASKQEVGEKLLQAIRQGELKI